MIDCRKRLVSNDERAISAAMDQDVKAPKLTGTARLDATSDAAYAIIDKRALDRESKTLKLRQLRLEKEAAERGAKAAAVSTGITKRTNKAKAAT